MRDATRQKAVLQKYVGLTLSLLGITATGWLALTGRLSLYIHPRYVVFTTIMSAIAAVLTIAGFGMLPNTGDHSDHEDHSHGRRSTLAIAVLVVGAVLALILVPPATLSVGTAEQRKVNQTLGSTTITSTAVGAPGDADYSHFRLRDWATSIQLAATPAVLRGRPFDETGFVAPTGGKRSDLFYLARFVVTCCAVDAQPVGVPIYLPSWHETHKDGSWLRVRGTLGPDPHDPKKSVVIPGTVTVIPEPSQPYEH